jgi:hypothetical protein
MKPALRTDRARSAVFDVLTKGVSVDVSINAR